MLTWETFGNINPSSTSPEDAEVQARIGRAHNFLASDARKILKELHVNGLPDGIINSVDQQIQELPSRVNNVVEGLK